MQNKIIIAVVVLILAAIGGGWYFTHTNAPTTPTESATNNLQADSAAPEATTQTTQSVAKTTVAPVSTASWKKMIINDIAISFRVPQDWVFARLATADPVAGDLFSIGSSKDENSAKGDVTTVQVTTSTSTRATYCPTNECTDSSFAKLRVLPNGSKVTNGNTISMTKTGNTTINGYPAVTLGRITWVRSLGKNWYIIAPYGTANRAVFDAFLPTLTLK